MFEKYFIFTKTLIKFYLDIENTKYYNYLTLTKSMRYHVEFVKAFKSINFVTRNRKSSNRL